MKMIFPVEDGEIFQPAMLVYQRVDLPYLVSTDWNPKLATSNFAMELNFSGP